jgi:hypothetical protein
VPHVVYLNSNDLHALPTCGAGSKCATLTHAASLFAPKAHLASQDKSHSDPWKGIPDHKLIPRLFKIREIPPISPRDSAADIKCMIAEIQKAIAALAVMLLLIGAFTVAGILLNISKPVVYHPDTEPVFVTPSLAVADTAWHLE